MNKEKHEHKAIGILRGKTITNVFYTEEEGESYLIPTLELDNKILLYLQSDDEGNGAGTFTAIHRNIEGQISLMPQIYL